MFDFKTHPPWYLAMAEWSIIPGTTDISYCQAPDFLRVLQGQL